MKSYETTVVPLQIAYADDMYEGIPAQRVSVITESPNSGGAIKIYSDLYINKADNSVLYGHWKAVGDGQVLMEEDIPANRDGIADMDIARAGDIYGTSPLTWAGTETITINGHNYDCTRYTYVYKGITRTVWYTPQAPMPVKMQWIDTGITNINELLDWR